VILDAYTLTDITSSFSLSPRLELRARLHNLFDETYQEVYSYGTSPRAVFVGLGAKL
jgi:vitamin B12 transporter